MSVQTLLTELGLTMKSEGSQWIINCVGCGRGAKAHADKVTGLWHCKVCEAKGNPYQLVKLLDPNMTPKGIMGTLDRHGLADGTQKAEKPKPKDLSWLRDHIRKPVATEIERVCKAKDVDRDALLSFEPMVNKKDPIMYLPGFVPNKTKAVGLLRVHMDGQTIETANGPQKYPMLGSWGLMGLHAAVKAEVIIFCEGWRDALAAIEAGHVAIANTGGTGWRDEWLPLFKGKKVYIVPDADTPGVKAAKKRAEKITPVAAFCAIVALPYKVKEKQGMDLFDYLNGRKDMK